jgi:hypothetical protein
MVLADVTVMLAHDICISHAHRSIDNGYEPVWEEPWKACIKVHKEWLARKLYIDSRAELPFVNTAADALP